MQATNLLNSLIEGAADNDIYQKLATSFDDFLILTRRMQYVYERFLTEVLGVTKDPAATDAKARETRV
jgi:Mn-dependent DtxR family transcriptional regulator